MTNYIFEAGKEPRTEPLSAEQIAERDAWAAGQTARNVLAEINRLESLETPRRLAEAVLTAEGKTWLANNRALIAIERAKL